MSNFFLNNPNNNLNDIRRLENLLNTWAKKHSKPQTLYALSYAKEKHEGQYRSNGTPYFIHPLQTAAHALSLGIKSDALIASCLLHDVSEDCNVPPKELPFSRQVQKTVCLLTFSVPDGQTKAEAKQHYFKRIARHKASALVKSFDRCNNISSMSNGFSDDRIQRYIDETRQMVFPMMEQAYRSFPDIRRMLFALRYHIESVIEAIK